MASFPEWTIILIVVIVLARVTVLLARRFDLPTATLQLTIGILLGPSLFNVLGTPIILGTWGSPAPGPIHAVLKILAEIGLIQLMFLAGLGADWRELKKIFRSSLSLGAWGFLLTGVSITILTRLFLGRWTEALAMSAIMVASSFGISAYNFNEMKFLGSRAANVLLGAAGVCGVLAILLMIASQAANYGMSYGVSRMAIAVSWFLAKLIMFLAITYFSTSRFLKLGSKSGFEKRPRQVLIGYLLLVAALYALASMHFGSFAAVGVASLGGALLGLSNLEAKEKIAEGSESILASIPMGILFIVIGMEVNLRAAESSIIFLALLIGTVSGSKLMGCWVATRKGHESPGERALIMFGSLHQGEMGILIAAYLFSRGLVDPSQFNIAIILVVLLTTFTPIAMKVAQIKSNIQLNVAPQCAVGEKRHHSSVARPLQRRE
jgi:Kef-type K+ transport system membrane component KefB